MSDVKENNLVTTSGKQIWAQHKQLPSKSQLSEYQVDDLQNSLDAYCYEYSNRYKQTLDWYDLGIFKYQNVGWVKSFLRSLKFLKINDLCIVLYEYKAPLPSIILKLSVNKNLTFLIIILFPRSLLCITQS